MDIAISETLWGNTKETVAKQEKCSRLKRLSSIGGSLDSGFVDHTDHVAETRVRGGSLEADHSPDSLTSSSERIDQQTNGMKQTIGMKQTKEEEDDVFMKHTKKSQDMELIGKTIDTLSCQRVMRKLHTDLTEQTGISDDKQMIELSVVLDGYGGFQEKTEESNCGKQTRYFIKREDHHSSKQTILDETDEVVRRTRIQHVLSTNEPNCFHSDVTHGENKQSKTPQFRASVCTNNFQEECMKPTGNDLSKETQFQDTISETIVQTYLKGTQLGLIDHNMTKSSSEFGDIVEPSADETERETTRDNPTKSITTRAEPLINEDVFTSSRKNDIVGELREEENDTKLFLEESTFCNEEDSCFEEDDTIFAERVVTLSATPNGSIVSERESFIVAESVEKMSCAPKTPPTFSFIEQPVTERVMLKWPFSNGRFLRAIEDTDNPVLIIDVFRSRFRHQYCFTSDTKFALDDGYDSYYLKCFCYEFHGQTFYLAPEVVSGVCGTTMKFVFVRETREHVVERELSLNNIKFWFNFEMHQFTMLQSLPFPSYYISLEKGARVLLRRTKDTKPNTRNFHIQIIPLHSHTQSSHKRSGLLSCFR